MCWYNVNERRQYNTKVNPGMAKMNSDETCTNFNIQHISYHAKCIEMDIECNNFSISHTNYDAVYIQVGV